MTFGTNRNIILPEVREAQITTPLLGQFLNN